MPSNLPTQLDKITAFKGKPYTLPLEYEAGYTFSEPTAIVKYRGRELPEAQQPEVTAVDNLLTVELPTALTSVAYNLLDLFIFDGGEPHFTAKVEIAERGGTPDVSGYQVSTPSGTTVQVTVNSLTQFNTYLTQTGEYATQAQEAAAQTAQDVITTGADAEAVELTRQDVAAKSATVNTQHGQVQGWHGQVSDDATAVDLAATEIETKRQEVAGNANRAEAALEALTGITVDTYEDAVPYFTGIIERKVYVRADAAYNDGEKSFYTYHPELGVAFLGLDYDYEN